MAIVESKNKYRNLSRDRDAELAAEILAEENKNLESETPVEPTVKPEEESWKKRYGDLRSYAQKEKDALALRIKELEETVASVKQVKTPKTKEEVLEWKTKFPDVFDMVKTIAMETDEETQKKYDDRFKELDEREHKMARKKAYGEVCEVHSDFPELVDDEKFQNWIEDAKTPQWVRHALAVNDTDSQIAIDAVDLYKLKHKIKTPKEQDDTRDAARAIKTPSRDAPINDTATWSESKVEALNRRDTEKYWPDIEAAMAEGKFVYDISGAAR